MVRTATTRSHWPLAGERVKRRMEERGVRIADLQRSAGVYDETIRIIIRGENVVRPATLAKVSTALGWEPSAIAAMRDGGDPIEAAGADPELVGRVEDLEHKAAERFTVLEGRLAQTDAKVDEILRLLRGREA